MHPMAHVAAGSNRIRRRYVRGSSYQSSGEQRGQRDS
jgi:hypothetical protein